MKTESDILLEILGDKLVSLNATFLGQTAADPYINISAFPLVYEAMRLYSDQQNKELREENDKLSEMLVGAVGQNAEIQRLTKEVEELKRPLGNSAHPIEDRLIEQAKQEAKNWKNPECFIGGFGWGCGAAAKLEYQELTRLRELLAKYSGAVAATADFLKNLNTEIDQTLKP